MKTLIIIRHSIAGWNADVRSDFDRTLTDEGKALAASMAHKLASRIKSVDKIISSSANRAFNTAQFFADALHYDNTKIETDEGFYSRGVRYIMSVLSKQSKDIKSILLVGHNPVFSELVSSFIGDRVGGLPTCGMVCLSLDMTDWNEVDIAPATFLSFDFKP
jgi:phosphohistidine phosphatase